jgi:hypothetical protein
VGFTAGVALMAIVLSMSTTRSAIAESIKATTTLIVNTAAEPVPVTGDDGTKELFSESAGFQFGNNAGSCEANVAVVPQGKRLVVEFMSVTAEMNGGDNAILVNIRPSSGPDSNHILASVVPVFGGTTPNGLRWFGVSQPVKLYFDQGENFMICAFKSGTSDAAFFQASVSGYFVNRP